MRFVGSIFLSALLLLSDIRANTNNPNNGNINPAPPTPAPAPSLVAAEGAEGGHCQVEYTSTERGNSGKFFEQFVQNDDFPCTDSMHTCVPDSYDALSNGFLEGTCGIQTCHGKQKPGFDEDLDLDPTNEATIRVTICHRTCSATNPWVRITIDDDAWGGDAASGCGHQLQHNVTEDCNIEQKEAQSEKTADDIWGVGRRVDYLIVAHGTRATLRTEMGCSDGGCNAQGNGCKFDDAEKDYWFYWERACPYVRHGACCGSYETGACCGDNPYPNEVDSDIELKKYACLKSATCSGNGVPTDCEYDLLTLTKLAGEATPETKYCYTVENTGA